MKMENKKPKLRANTLGLVGAGTLGAIMLSPALGIYGNFAAMESTAGVVTSLIFLISMFIALPSAISYAMVAKEIPSAGSAYAWLWKATKPGVGLWVGWIMTAYYVVVVFLQPILFGLFFNEFVKFFGITPSNWTYLLGVVLATAIVAPAVYKEVNVTAKTAVIFMLFEMVTILALTITILFVQGSQGHLSAAPFNPSAASGGFHSIYQAVLFGILAFTGFDVISTVAEETKTPKILIPKATIFAVLLIGIFWMFTSWAFSLSVSPEQVAKLASHGVTPITPIANIYWHKWDIIVTITGMTAATGSYLGGMLTIGRVLFAMGRDGTMPKGLGKLHPKFQTPWNALHVGFILVIVVAGFVSMVSGPTNVWIWCGEATVFFAVLTYLFVNLSNILYYARYKKENFHWFWNGFVPIVGILVLAFTLYQAFFVSLWGADFALGKSVVLACLLFAVIGVVYVQWLGKKQPELFLKTNLTEEKGDSSRFIS
jgi:amino acid transporter